MIDELTIEESYSFRVQVYRRVALALAENGRFNNVVQKGHIANLVRGIVSGRANERIRMNRLDRLSDTTKRIENPISAWDIVEDALKVYDNTTFVKAQKEYERIVRSIENELRTKNIGDALYAAANGCSIILERLENSKRNEKEARKEQAAEAKRKQKEQAQKDKEEARNKRIDERFERQIAREEEREKRKEQARKERNEAYGRRVQAQYEREKNRKKIAVPVPSVDRERTTKFKDIKSEKPVKDDKKDVFTEVNMEATKGRIKKVEANIIDSVRNLFEIDTRLMSDSLIEDAMKIYANIRFLSGRIGKDQYVDAYEALYDLARDIPSVYTQLMSRVNNDSVRSLVHKVGALNWLAVYEGLEKKVRSLKEKLDDHEKETVEETRKVYAEIEKNEWFYYPLYVSIKTNELASSAIGNLEPNWLDDRDHLYYLPLYYLSYNMDYDQIARIYKNLVKNDHRINEENHGDLQRVFIDVLQERIDAFDPKKKMNKDVRDRKNELERAGIAKDYLGEEYMGSLRHIERDEVVKEHMKFKGISSEAKKKTTDRFFGLSRAAKVAAKISQWGKYQRLVSKEVLNNKEIDELDQMFRGR